MNLNVSQTSDSRCSRIVEKRLLSSLDKRCDVNFLQCLRSRNFWCHFLCENGRIAWVYPTYCKFYGRETLWKWSLTCTVLWYDLPSEKFAMSIKKMHAYVQQLSCSPYDPRYESSVGNTVGEVCERFLSILTRMIGSMQHMTEENWQDISKKGRIENLVEYTLMRKSFKRSILLILSDRWQPFRFIRFRTG